MTHTSTRTRLLASSMISGFALAAAGGAFAQTAPAPAATGAPAATVGEIVVTGSRIPQPNLTSIAPVTAVTSQQLQLSGTTRVEDLVNQLPQVVAAQGDFLANGATGTATISLRGLGDKRTLVLIDGRRVVPGDPTDPVPDINFIPAALIDRVEVDMAGASAVYGADAVAGVVNFIMKKNFQGLQLDVNYGLYENDNGSTLAQQANATSGFPYPTGSVWDGNTVDATVIFGVNSPDGKGNVEGYVGYRHTDAVLEATRDYSTCTIAVVGTKYACSGSSTDAYGRFIVYGPNFSVPPGASSAPEYSLYGATGTGAATTFPAYTGKGLFNYGALNYFQRPDERYTGGFFAHYDISPLLQPYAQFMFMDDHTEAQIAPSGSFGFTETIPCSDPLLTTAEQNAICTQYGLATGPASTDVNNSVIILRRNVEGGNRVDDRRHDDYRAIIGMKGDFNDNFHYDAYAMYGASLLSEEYINDVSKIKLARALDVVPDPTTGAPVCASTLSVGGAAPVDPACVPWNIWVPGGVTSAATNYIGAPGFQEAQLTEQVVSGAITGDLGPYGAKSPWATDGLGFAIGGEYRRETENFQNDVEFLTGDLAGQGGSRQNVTGEYDVKEFFGEARIPIVQNVPFFKDLSADLGYRYSDYNLEGGTTTYKITGDWAITDDIRIRGGFNRSVRAPNILELYTPNFVALDGNTDNCTGPTPTYTAAQCANTGVTAAQYGHLAPNPASQYNGLIGGNVNLRPEKANTYSVGVVLTPHEFLRGFHASVDYFNINIQNVVQSYGADNILDQCALTGNPTFCNLVHRNNIGSLWLGTTALGLPTTGYIVDTVQNAGYIKESGVDFAADYRFRFRDLGVGDWGGLAFDFNGTYVHDYLYFSGIPGASVLSCVGKYGLVCGNNTTLSGPLPSWKHKLRVTWSTPWDGLELSVAWRYTGAVNLDTGQTGCADCHIEAYNWFDLAGQWRFRDRYTFRAGVNNIFDRDPPIVSTTNACPSTFCTGNTFPQVYDPLGRYIFVGLTADF